MSVEKQIEHILYEYEIALHSGNLQRALGIEQANTDLAGRFAVLKHKAGYRRDLAVRG